jgi:hypothetical protein
MNFPEEPLRFRGIGFPPMFSLLKPTFSLLFRLRPLMLTLQSITERSPTEIKHPTASAKYLVPFIFGAGSLDQ